MTSGVTSEQESVLKGPSKEVSEQSIKKKVSLEGLLVLEIQSKNDSLPCLSSTSTPHHSIPNLEEAGAGKGRTPANHASLVREEG